VASGREDRIRLLNNVDTLAKSRKDAEEERQTRLNSGETVKGGRRLALEWEDEENGPVNYLEQDRVEQQPQAALDMVSVGKYLTYNNPQITSFTNHIFVSSALFAAKVLSILPGNRVTTDFFTAAVNTTGIDPGLAVERRTSSFHIPTGINETTAASWKERIGEEVLALRQRKRNEANSAITTPLMSHSPQAAQTTIPRIDCHTMTEPDRIDATFNYVSDHFRLNEAQRRAYYLFLRPLKRLLVSPHSAPYAVDDDVENRCMYLGGPGGTGKSQVIKAIIETFRQLNCSEQLLVCATTGVAANLIGGSTVDSLLKLRRGSKHYKDTDDLQRGDNSSDYASIIENVWMTCNFLILDEVSMLGCAKLASISKMLEKNKSNSLAFGGVHILFSGDFFQLPAIGDICLYRIKSIRRKDSDAVVLGMYLWSQVIKTTVLLVEHYRAPNPEVYEVMERLRRGTLTYADIEKIKARVFGHPDGPDPSDPKWQDAPLITPRNTIRQAWNNQAAVRYGIRTGKQIFISPLLDTGV